MKSLRDSGKNYSNLQKFSKSTVNLCIISHVIFCEVILLSKFVSDAKNHRLEERLLKQSDLPAQHANDAPLFCNVHKSNLRIQSAKIT